MSNFRKRALLVLAAALLVVPSVVLAGPSDAVPEATGLEKQVRHELLLLPYYSVFDNLNFQVEGVNVTLTGQVTNPTLKASAERAVRRLEGVESVANEIAVLPLSAHDDLIRWRMFHAIYGNSALHKYGVGANRPIHIIVQHGHVTLLGVVLNEMDKTITSMAANRVPGVFSVSNQLRIG